MKNYVLESPKLRMEFCSETGALVAFKSLETGWAIIDRPHIGRCFRLMVPLGEEMRNNDVLGEKQKCTSIQAEENCITFNWNGVESERGGFHPINITIRVAIEGNQAVYYTKIENNSEYTVEAVYSPYLGDVRPPMDGDWFKSFHYAYASKNEQNLWPTFDNIHGYFGTDYPTQMRAKAPSCPFYLMRSEKQGLYAGVKAHSFEPVAWAIELRPGYETHINHMRPKTDDIAGKPVHTPFAAIHMPYILAGETRDLTPIALEPYTGGWQKAADIYRQWRDSWFRQDPPPIWSKDPHSWQQLHINGPEDELRLRFTELPKVAEECKSHGVDIIQLVGWNDGGQDQGNPSHDPDPRLGTWDELKNAIEECHKIGVKIILFTKFTWADRATDWFRKELKNCAITDPYGDYYLYSGYQYFTPAQLLDLNTKRLIPMCFNSEAYMEVCEKEFKKVLDLGAAGMLYDEAQHHYPTWLCFNTDHGHRYGEPTYSNDIGFIRRLVKKFDVSQDFLIAGEASYDWEREVYQLSYHRSEWPDHVPLSRYLTPRALFMTAVTGFNDRNMINQCLMFNYIISYEPYNFKGKLGDYPETVEYGKKMDALRTEYRKWFWDGEYRDTCDAACTDKDGNTHPTYSVFKAEDGTLGAVISNYTDESVTVTLKAKQNFTKYRAIDVSQWKDANADIEIAPRSAVIVI
ncbi:MAG: DUF6259 domain-containing protein [Defluviitaleaceae bacterium]|nr:DUF6259 domain-containing protein [Defluviitaleaceae bacterium]